MHIGYLIGTEKHNANKRIIIRTNTDKQKFEQTMM